MKKRMNSMIVILLISFFTFSVSGQKENKQFLEFDYMDLSVLPKDDFYHFANGTWMKNNPIPEEESRWSSFNVLADQNMKTLHGILMNAMKNPGESRSASQLIGDYYTSYMDTTLRNNISIKPIEEYLQLIASIENNKDLQHVIVSLQNMGISNLFHLYVSQDKKNNELYRVHLYQGGLGLPNKDYYFKEDERSERIRTKYAEFIELMFEKDNIDVKENREYVYAIEKKLAESSRSPVELREVENQYNPMSVDQLQVLCPNINWSLFFKERGLENVDTLIVGQPDFFVRINELMNSVNVEHWKSYLKWNLIRSTASLLSMDYSRMSFYFNSTVMRGTKKMKPLWKRGVKAVTSSAIGEALGQAFVEQNFSESAKKMVNEMVDNITLVFEDRINELEWMSDSTKLKANEKLGSFARKLGFPDEWEDFSSIIITRDSYASNAINCWKFSVNKNISKLGKPIDRKKWSMFPQIVNAYYNPLLNEIVFPAGIMQPPFFSEDYEDAVNYARMGAVIGHELTHGFDDNGSKFSSDGRMINWWTNDDKKKFDERTQKLIDQYNSFEVLDNVFVNGKLTLGENIADLGGLTIAYYAYMKSLEGKEKQVINGYSPEQRFFIAFAHVWKNNIRDNALIARIKSDSHSPGIYRVNGTLSNMPEFFEAFDIKEGDPMRQPKDKIARIW